jgi:hypothetical protein
MRLKERVKALEDWVERISAIQNQLLGELDYYVSWRDPTNNPCYLVKKDKKKVSES